MRSHFGLVNFAEVSHLLVDRTWLNLSAQIDSRTRWENGKMARHFAVSIYLNNFEL